MASTEYVERHNNVTKTLHGALARKYDLIDSEKKYYEY